MPEPEQSQSQFHRGRRKRSRGAELIEFTMVFLPFLAIITVLLDTCWAIFVKSSLQYAVRTGVRVGITLTTSTVTGDLTSTVKSIVKANSFGMLKDTSLIHVHYLQPPSPGSTDAAADVSTSTNPPGNAPGNIMVVSVDNYSLPALIARIYNWKSVDKSATNVTVVSADLIEPMNKDEIPPIGTAP